MDNQKIPAFLLRLGLAFVFLYAAIASYFYPNDWLGFLPLWLKNLTTLAPEKLLFAFGFYQIILGLWVLTGWRLFYSSLFAALTIFLIIIFNLGSFQIVFRDVAIFFSALELTFLSRSS